MNKKKLIGVGIVISSLLIGYLGVKQSYYKELKEYLLKEKTYNQELNIKKEERMILNNELIKEINDLKEKRFNTEIELNKVDGVEITVSIDDEFTKEVKSHYPPDSFDKYDLILKVAVTNTNYSDIDWIKGALRVYDQKDCIYQGNEIYLDDSNLIAESWNNPNTKILQKGIAIDVSRYKINNNRLDWNINDLEFRFHIHKIKMNGEIIQFEILDDIIETDIGRINLN